MVSVSQLRITHFPWLSSCLHLHWRWHISTSKYVSCAHTPYPLKVHQDSLVCHCLSFQPCSEAAILSPPVPPPPATLKSLVWGLLFGGIFVAFFGPNQDILSLQNPSSQNATTWRTLKTCYIETATFSALFRSFWSGPSIVSNNNLLLLHPQYTPPEIPTTVESQTITSYDHIHIHSPWNTHNRQIHTDRI